MYYDPSGSAISDRYGASVERNVPVLWLGTIVCVLISALIFLVSTRYGIGILPDSTRYMSIDERPFDAPMYPWLLMGFAATGFGLDFGAKLAGLLLVCVNSALIWHLLVRTTGKHAYAAVGTAIIILSPQFVYLHSIAMSEPLFITFILLTLFALLRFWETDEQSWLLACGVAIGAAALVRFTAPPLGAAIALCFLFDPRHSFGRRILDVVRLAVVSAAIFLLWMFASEALLGRSTGRPLEFLGNMDAQAWLSSLEALMAWLLPEQIPLAGRIAVFASAVAGGIYLSVWHGRRAIQITRESKVASPMLATALGFFFLAYLAFMVLATSLEANLSLNTRYAFPIYVTTAIMLTIILAHAADASGPVKRVHWAFVGLATLVLASHIVRSTDRTIKAYDEGIGFASRSWVNSPTMRAVAELPASAKLYSNGPDVIAYVLKRPAHYIPMRVDVRTGKDDPANPFAAQVARLRRDVANGTAVIIYLNEIDFRFYVVPETELDQFVSLKAVGHYRDGRIYAPSQALGKD